MDRSDAEGPSDRSATIAILVNILAPYRIPVYEGIAERFRTFVFFAGGERNRGTWDGSTNRHHRFTARRSTGFSIRTRVGGEQLYDEKYLHLPFGHLIDLWRTRPQAIITTEMGLRTVLVLLYGAVCHVPIWIWWGGTLHTERGRGPGRRLLRHFISRCASRWISYGATSTRYLTSLGISPDRIVQIQNCVDESLYLPVAVERGPRGNPPVFLYVGQMIRRKGVDRLLEAAAVAQRNGCSFVLRLIGDGPEKEAFQRMAEDLGLRDVEFQEGLPPSAMPEIYRAADFFVFPTREDVWGLVVNEALWSGLPVLSSIHAGCATELLPLEQTFDPLDTEEFARVIEAAVSGSIGAPDTAPLKKCAEVISLIVTDLERTLATGSQ